MSYLYLLDNVYFVNALLVDSLIKRIALFNVYISSFKPSQEYCQRAILGPKVIHCACGEHKILTSDIVFVFIFLLGLDIWMVFAFQFNRSSY